MRFQESNLGRTFLKMAYCFCSALDQGRGPKLQASRTVGAGLALPGRGRGKQRPYGVIPAEATTQLQLSPGQHSNSWTRRLLRR